MNANAICEVMLPKDYKSDLKPIWCPGCGDFSVLQALYRALAAVGRPPHETAFVSGIGCSSRIPGYTTAYGFNSLHGRSLPIAQGIKLANPDLLVLAAGGDGDGFSIGGGHIAHLVRRNMDITYIVMDNQIYGLTKGQLSPTSARGRITCTSHFGSLEEPVNPLLYLLGYGANFVAQGSPADMGSLAAITRRPSASPAFLSSTCSRLASPTAKRPSRSRASRPSSSLWPASAMIPAIASRPWTWPSTTAASSTRACSTATLTRHPPTNPWCGPARRKCRRTPRRKRRSWTSSSRAEALVPGAAGHLRWWPAARYFPLGNHESRDTLTRSGVPMLSIRLARNGAKKRPFYHIVVSENDRIPTGQALEVLGFVNPIATAGETVRIDAEKAKAWIAKGASPSKTVVELFKKHAIL